MDKYGNNIIHYASRSGHFPVVQYLIEQQNVEINIKGENGKTPLHYACEKGHLSIAEYLTSKGADIKSTDNNFRNPLDYASAYGKNDIVNYFVSREAYKNIIEK